MILKSINFIKLSKMKIKKSKSIFKKESKILNFLKLFSRKCLTLYRSKINPNPIKIRKCLKLLTTYNVLIAIKIQKIFMLIVNILICLIKQIQCIQVNRCMFLMMIKIKKLCNLLEVWKMNFWMLRKKFENYKNLIAETTQNSMIWSQNY